MLFPRNTTLYDMDITEHSEGVESQIKDIKEDINKLGNDGFNVEVRLSSSSTRKETVSK